MLDHVEVRYAGQVGIENLGAIETDSVPLSMTSSNIADGAHVGVDALAGSNPTLESDLIVQNASGSGGSRPVTATLVNDTIDGNAVFGLILDGGTATLVNDLVTEQRQHRCERACPVQRDLQQRRRLQPRRLERNYFGLADPTGTSGNLAADPRYFNAASLQYELHPGSPAEDAGTVRVLRRPTSSGTRFQYPNIIGRGDGSGVDIGAIWVEQIATSKIDLATTGVSGPATGSKAEVDHGRLDRSERRHDGGHRFLARRRSYPSPSPVLTPDAILLGQVLTRSPWGRRKLQRLGHIYAAGGDAGQPLSPRSL